MQSGDNQRRVGLIGLALCLVTILLYLPVLQHDFINFDDSVYVTENSFVQSGINASTLFWAFTTGHASNWHPLTWISHMLDWQLYGSHPGGPHFTNVLFHAANTLLLFLLLRRMIGALWRSALVAALFAWHPLHVESVAWLAERKDVLSTLFWLLTMWAYVDYVQGSKAKKPRAKFHYNLALVWFALGLMSKPMLVTLPFVLLLLDYWPLDRVADRGVAKDKSWLAWGWLVREKIPFFILAMLSSVITFLVQRKGGAMTAMEHLPFSWRLGNALLGYAGYLRKMVWPLGLAIFYPLPDAFPASHWIAAAALLAVVSGAVFALRRTQPMMLMGWLWFLGTLVPVIGLVQVGSQSMADRYTYMPLVGIFILVVWGGAELFGKISAGRNIASAISVLILAMCLALTSRQLRHWQNSITLFRHALDVTTHNIVAHIDLGRALDDAGKPDEAKAEFNAALNLEPKSADALTGLGLHFAKQGDLTNAAGYYHSALVNQPFFSDAHYNLGNLLAREGKLPEAADQYVEALRIKPDAPDAENNLGAVLLQVGRLDEAMTHFQTALRLRPNFPEAQDQLGSVMQKKGRLDQARFHYAEAVRLKPNFPHAQLRLGLLMAQQGDVAEAIPHFQTVIALEPTNAYAHFDLGAAYAALGNWNAAAQSFATAAKFKPDDADIQKRLAEAQAKVGGVQNAK